MHPTTAWFRASLRLWNRRLKFRKRRLAKARRDGSAKRIEHWHRLVDKASWHVKRREQQIHARRPLRLRALTRARDLIGVMESGGNNVGPTVSRIIRAQGGTPGQPWCGYFAGYCYRLAGSKAVTWQWAAVRLISAAAGVRRTSKPLPGDLVRFNFDHVGLFEKDNGDGTITTLEGNTGASGAVSDSKTGGDGVYRKIRAKGLVSDYLRVTR